MSHPDDLLSSAPKPMAPLLAISVASSLLIFVATYFIYFSRHQSEVAGGYMPLAVGIGAFFSLMSWFNYLALPSQSFQVRLAKAGGIALAESVVFLILLLFLVLNTIGS